MVTKGTSSGNAAENPPTGRPQETSAASPGSKDDTGVSTSLTDNFGEPAELQDRVIQDRTMVVDRDGTSVLTDSPREGDLPMSVAQQKRVEEEKP